MTANLADTFTVPPELRSGQGYKFGPGPGGYRHVDTKISPPDPARPRHDLNQVNNLGFDT